ncbi:MAG TPA: protein kinase [Kofleriaceae bacterium]|nr:protein kinase [Kofleriaceae bacterium]
MGIEADAIGPADERFVVRGKLGAGGMGVVYRVLDQIQQREVALKTLKTHSARDLYRFKREFRALCDLAHPNLCALHELHTTGDDWFFTMELVHGVGFIDWVRPSSDSDQPFLDRDDGETQPRGSGPRSRTEIMSAPVDLERLERSLGQLCDGVHALHTAGKLHRDLKPSNVLVEPTGRVVLLDFGLVADLEQPGVDQTHERAAVGTPAYMSPEQAADVPLTPASDWYSVGVILYEALTGRRPFEGRAEEVMRRKQLERPPRPRQLVADTPRFLDDLCMRLLEADPRDRPDGIAVLDALGREPSMATATVERTSGAGPFVGREAQLDQLHQALLDARKAGVGVLVRGASGMGKSALVQRFLHGVAGGALVLSGRCYERESVPYKTLDTLIDALTTALLKLDPAELQSVLPHDVAALGRLFPVLRRVPQIAEPAVRRFQPADPQELRRRAFSALRYLLGSLGQLRPVVVCIDDLQWGDVDSALFLGDLISRADRPPILVILTYRSEGAGGPAVAEVVRRVGTATGDADVRTLDVPPLAIEDARDLVRALSGFEGDVDAWAEALIRDAGGNTMFLAELARSAGTAGGAPTLDELLRGRIARLPAEARALLTACAVAARPTALDVAARAAGLSDPTGALAVLRAERLLRAQPEGDRDRVEPFHDRIRVTVLDDLATGELQAVHRDLAAAYQYGAPGEPEPLVDHLLGAGETRRAAEHAAAAARAAEDALAFRRASDLYAIALEYGAKEGVERARLLRARARALVNAGQLIEAAAMYADASRLLPEEERFELERLRLEQLLRAGQLREGVANARTLLASIGYHLPETGRAATWEIVKQRVALRVRGLGFTPRPAGSLPPDAVRQVDLMWSVASGLSFADPMLGKIVQLWHLRRALALGDLARFGAALSIESGYLATLGVSQTGRVEALVARAREVSKAVGDPAQSGLVEAGFGLALFMFGRWREAREQIEAGLRMMRDHGVDARWQIDISEAFLLGVLYYLGEVRELVRWTPIFLREAEDRGDVYAQHSLRAWRSNQAWLAMGKPEDARAHILGVALERGDVGAFHLHDYYQLISNIAVDLYVGDDEGALARFDEATAPLDRSLLLRIQGIRVEGTFARGRAALAAALAGPAGKRAERLAVVRRAIALLAKERMVPARGYRAQLAAGVAQAEGRVDDGVRAYRQAAEIYRDGDMRLHACVARLAVGELVGGDEGARLRDDAVEWLRDQAVADPLRFSRTIAPRPA